MASSIFRRGLRWCVRATVIGVAILLVLAVGTTIVATRGVRARVQAEATGSGLLVYNQILEHRIGLKAMRMYDADTGAELLAAQRGAGSDLREVLISPGVNLARQFIEAKWAVTSPHGAPVVLRPGQSLRLAVEADDGQGATHEWNCSTVLGQPPDC